MTQQQYTQLRQATSYYKGSEGNFSHHQEWIWQDDAACAFLPATMFEVAVSEDPIAEGLSRDELLDLNSTNIEAAIKVCKTCPVRDMCRETAEPIDFLNTVRGGAIPINRGSTRAPSGGKCDNDHNNWVLRKDGASRYCKTCSDLSAQERRIAKGMIPRVKTAPLERGVKCRAGLHDDWQGKPGKYQCRPCRAEKDAASYRAKRDAKLAP